MKIIEEILSKFHTVALVGFSSSEEKPSHSVGKYLLDHGFDVIPVNDRYEVILGQRCFPNLSSVPIAVDVVDIFRRPKTVPSIVDEAIIVGVKAIWIQEGIINEEAAQQARAAGIAVVMDKCLRKKHFQFTKSRL